MSLPVRPVITNFSSGEIDPRLDGRVDLSFYPSAARELTNFFPSRLGGVFKRGGLAWQLNCPVAGSATRLIPWSISASVSLLVVLYNSALKLLDVSGPVPVFMTTVQNGSDVTLTTMDGNATIPLYALADIPYVQYAQNLNEITMVHKNYPPFYLRVDSVDTSTHRVSLSYGIHELFANMAYNLPGTVEDDGTEVKCEDVADALREFDGQGDVPCDVDSFIYVNDTKYRIISVNVAHTLNSSYLRVYDTSQGRNGTYTDYAYPSAGLFPKYLWWDIKYHDFELWDWVRYDYVASTTADVAANSVSVTNVFDTLMARFGAGNWFKCMCTPGTPPSGTWTVFGPRYNLTDRAMWGIVRYKPATFSLVITHTGGVSTYTSTGFEIRMSVTIGGRKIVSGARVTGGLVFDSIAAWMKRDVLYQCDPSMKVNGSTVATAMKTLSGGEEVITFGGYAITAGNPSGSLTIHRETSGILGQVGVILTPFYRTGDHPSVVGYHQGRLCLGGNGNILYLSKPNDHSNFSFFEDIEFDSTTLKPSGEWLVPTIPETRTDSDKTQQVGAGSGIRLEIASEENEDIQWVVSVGSLIIGTSTSEWVLPEQCNAMDARVVQDGRSGSYRIQPRYIGDFIVHCGPSGKEVMGYVPGQRTDKPSLSEHARSMFEGAVTAFDFRQSPQHEMYFVLDTGTVLRMQTPEEEPMGTGDRGMMRPQRTRPQWSRLKTFNYDGSQAIVESVAVVSSSGEDAVFFTVKRTIAGATVRTIERLSTQDDLLFAGRGHLDCSIYAASTGAGTLSGYTLYGTDTVKCAFRTAGGVEYRGTIVFAAGSATQYTDSVTGTLTNIPANSEMWLGYGYISRLETFRIDSVETEGIAKGGGQLHIRLFRSGRFKMMRGYFLSDPGYDIYLPDGAVYPYSGPVMVEHDTVASVDQSIIIQSVDDQPVNILVLAPWYTAE